MHRNAARRPDVPPGVIGRWWRGWATAENGPLYEELLRTRVLPGIHRLDGYRGAYLLRREVEQGFEYATLTLWDSVEAIRAFSGDDVEAAVVPPDARALLSRFDERSQHFEILVEPER